MEASLSELFDIGLPLDVSGHHFRIVGVLVVAEIQLKLLELRKTEKALSDIKNQKLASSGSTFLQTKQQLLLNYCMNASFYLLLKVAIMLASLG